MASGGSVWLAATAAGADPVTVKAAPTANAAAPLPTIINGLRQIFFFSLLFRVIPFSLINRSDTVGYPTVQKENRIQALCRSVIDATANSWRRICRACQYGSEKRCRDSGSNRSSGVPMLDRPTKRVIALIVLLIVVATALRGYLPGGRPTSSPEAAVDATVSLAFISALLAISLAVIVVAVIGRLRQPRAARRPRGKPARRTRRQRRPAELARGADRAGIDDRMAVGDGPVDASAAPRHGRAHLTDRLEHSDTRRSRHRDAADKRVESTVGPRRTCCCLISPQARSSYWRC